MTLTTAPLVDAQDSGAGAGAVNLRERSAERRATQDKLQAKPDDQGVVQTGRQTIREKLQARRDNKTQKSNGEAATLGDREVNVWEPATQGLAPLVIFSHGFGGCPSQSTFLTTALAESGYLVIAPEHADANCGAGNHGKPEESFGEPESWTESTYRDRQDDIVAVMDALRVEPGWKARINWDQVGLMGHSLGGYTVLGLGRGWASWRISGVKAVLALSPVCQPFVKNGELSAVAAPVSFQGGTRDFGITPGVKRPGGCYDKARAPVHFVEFDGAGHFAWTDRQQSASENIIFYARGFFDAYVRGQPATSLHEKRPGVSELRWR